MTDFASAKYEIGKLVAEVESLRAQLAGWERMWTVLPEQHGDAVEQVRELVTGRDILRSMVADKIAALPDLDLLAKFASGEGGRRTGDLIRREFITVEVTEAGRAALEKR